MKSLLRAAALIVSLCAVASAGERDWPEGRRAAIALTYDDALASQLDVALPQLDEAGLKATFFLSRLSEPARIARWRGAAAAGHELANHTLFHPCARGAFEMADRYNNENYTIETMLDEIRMMNAFLHAIDGRVRRTYATPCGQTVVGDGDYIETLRASGLVTAARHVGPLSDEPVDPFNMPGEFFPETVTGEALIAWVERVVESGGFGVMGFHGVGGDYLPVTAEAHQALVDYLRAHEDDIWVVPFGELVDYLTETAPAR
ncbi:polysaccharide deacetylase family protein [Amphiplicatus metriothermophilus]|uniref:Chitooligosaccharide deacetylase n=1 Tax=Amphiplicatus metriothermophilus TaxID=1519374 RepID=A0A239PYY4_9PROT|nr:polysaccharide deacetylase family protein [Amphiplicatus metriothermophilus]MBB5518199.1 peptidoglycan/xylan/chitin deacetylase (PgdA/CDA1 family) [Amphiplicatus metriothermophilus]SNT75370.1 Peptidoglycan/xylan/chitin deacetylase, PgdA/CDA1 family [Amphiplicatus metriothermophilus]